MALKPITVRSFLVTISGLGNTYFTKATSPKESREVVEYQDGLTGTVRKMVGFTTRDNVTLSKPFYAVEDKALVNWYQNQKKTNAAKFVVSITPVNPDLEGSKIAGAATLTLVGCEVVSLKMPDIDRMGSGTAMVELELLYDDWSFS